MLFSCCLQLSSRLGVERLRMRWILLFLVPWTSILAQVPVPGDLLEEDAKEESGVNEFTVPSIARIFSDLEKISPLSYESERLADHKRLPLDRTQLALRLGTLIADGFLAVQTGKANDVPQIASLLNRYGRALGAGERVKRHAAALLDYAKQGNLKRLKRALARTQRDVEQELIALRDPDLSTLISLGGWLQALEAATTAVTNDYTEKQARFLFREDIADYYTETIGALDPAISDRPNILKIRTLLSGLRNSMALQPEEKATKEKVAGIHEAAQALSKEARK